MSKNIIIIFSALPAPVLTVRFKGTISASTIKNYRSTPGPFYLINADYIPKSTYCKGQLLVFVNHIINFNNLKVYFCRSNPLNL